MSSQYEIIQNVPEYMRENRAKLRSFLVRQGRIMILNQTKNVDIHLF